MTEKLPVFSRTISVGNILQIVVIVVGLAAAWYTMDNRSENNTKDLNNFRAEWTEFRREVREFDDRIRELENQQARADERFSNILTLLSRIDTRLERIEQGGR